MLPVQALPFEIPIGSTYMLSSLLLERYRLKAVLQGESWWLATCRRCCRPGAKTKEKSTDHDTARS